VYVRLAMPSSLHTAADILVTKSQGYPLDDWLLDQAEAGLSPYKIADRLAEVTGHVVNPTHQTIRNWLKEAGWEAQGKETA